MLTRPKQDSVRNALTELLTFAQMKNDLFAYILRHLLCVKFRLPIIINTNRVYVYMTLFL